MFKYDHLELARIIGEPLDPRRPYSNLVAAVCDTDSADPNEYVYSFDAFLDTDRVYTITSTGQLTTTNVSPLTPTLLTFTDIATDEFYVKITDLANAKERVLGRKKATINRALNAEENYQVIQVIDAAAVGKGNVNDLRSGEKAFNYQHLIDMIDQVIDYSEKYVLVAGTQIDKDVKLWDWTDNKYHSMIESFNDLGITVELVKATVTIDSTVTSVLSAYVGYLCGTVTEKPGKPILFVRKRMNEIEKLNGIISETGDMAERLVFASPNPVQVSGTRYLAVALTGYEEFTLATQNSYAFSKFSRTV